MSGGRLILCLLAAVPAAALGCGSDDPLPVAASCTGEPATIVRALDAAPGAVTLGDGARLSACIDRARSDADLQNVGVAFSRAAEDLEAPALAGDERAALELGYLVGAARRGAARSSGIAAELVHRLERSADLAGAPRGALDAVQRGLEAGARRG
jgi:hypothetical protein